MGLDIRWPIGIIFTIYGLVLTAFGAFTNPQTFVEHSMGVNIDVWWGAAMLVFGLFMGGLALRASRHNRP
jgi:hypothetical protein